MDINYKNKYNQLKLKFMNSVDMAFRLGFEQGMQGAQVQQAQQQQAQQDQMNSMQVQPGEQPQEGQSGEEQAPQSEHPDGSELDQHIAQLESLIGKSEVGPEELKKALDGLKSYKQQIDLSKSLKAIKVMNKPSKTFQIGKQASANLPDNAKKAIGLQEKIVGDIFKTWEEQEKKASKEIGNILSIEGLSKGE